MTAIMIMAGVVFDFEPQFLELDLNLLLHLEIKKVESRQLQAETFRRLKFAVTFAYLLDFAAVAVNFDAVDVLKATFHNLEQLDADPELPKKLSYICEQKYKEK